MQSGAVIVPDISQPIELSFVFGTVAMIFVVIGIGIYFVLLGFGIDVIEYATSLPKVLKEESSEVSPGIICTMTHAPLGVVAGITPFNFPVMVPLWMIPLAITTGNCFIYKPSEQTPLAGLKIAEYLKEAGLPTGVFSVVNGSREAVEGICDHSHISAVAFVGSSQVA